MMAEIPNLATAQLPNSFEQAWNIAEGLEHVLSLYVHLISFGIDIAAGIIIGISALVGLIAFLMILKKSPKVQTHRNRNRLLLL